MRIALTDQFGIEYVLLEPIRLISTALHGICFEAPYFNVEDPGWVDESGLFRIDRTRSWEPLPDLGQIELVAA